MLRHVLTGAPGAGKTTLLHALRDDGFTVVEEAATDVVLAGQRQGVDQPWLDEDFCDRILALQQERQAAERAPVQIVDRSPLCTLALSRHLRRPPSPRLLAEVERVVRDGVYQPTVLLVRMLGSITATAVRRIDHRQALEFEAVHQDVYRENGFTLLDVPVMPVAERAALVRSVVRRPGRGH